MNKITDAAVEAACKVIFGDYRRKPLYRRECEHEMRIALEAALPHLQPSPVGQGDVLPPLPPMGYEVRRTGMGSHDVYYTPAAYTAEQMQDYAQAALAARQPVGQEPVARVKEDGDIVEVGLSLAPGMYLYAAPPAQAVDLGQFRDAVMHAYGVVVPEDYCEKLGELLDLIDGKAVQQ